MTEDLENIFSMLHDGTIIDWTGDKTALLLTVDCQYLAERIDPSFDIFWVELTDISHMELSTWPNPFDLPVEIRTSPEDIFEAELEILSAEIQGDAVLVSCSQHDTAYDYCGGNLTIQCSGVKVYDQKKNEVTVDALHEICKAYWDTFGNP